MLFQAGRYKGSEEELPPFMAPRKEDPFPKEEEEEGSPGRWSDLKDSCSPWEREVLKIIFLLVFNK